MTDNEPTPWEKWVAKNLATPQQKIRWWLIVWGVCLLLSPIAVNDVTSAIGSRLILLGAVIGWIPALVIFVRQRKAVPDTKEEDQ